VAKLRRDFQPIWFGPRSENWRSSRARRELRDLTTPPGNRLEALKGDRSGQHSIRINDQFRICFVWKDGHAEDVEIADYH
jgi:plasmid maintenance system killer protein